MRLQQEKNQVNISRVENDKELKAFDGKVGTNIKFEWI
jgi:hypothetical protein